MPSHSGSAESADHLVLLHRAATGAPPRTRPGTRPKAARFGYPPSDPPPTHARPSTCSDLSANILRGPLPPSLATLAALEELRLDANQLAGPVPPELAGLADLAVFTASGNYLSGALPPSLGQSALLALACDKAALCSGTHTCQSLLGEQRGCGAGGR